MRILAAGIKAPTLVASRIALPPEGAGLAWGGPALRPIAPTLVASRTALPPEGAGLAWGGPALRPIAPTLVASRTALPPEGAGLAWAGPAPRPIAPTLVASRTALPPEGAGLAWGGPALATIAPTLIASLRAKKNLCGFTLIELLIVVAIMAVASAGVGLSLRDSTGTALEREAQRLAALLESARAQSRMSAMPVRWRTTAKGFTFDGLTESKLPTQWLSPDVQADGRPVITLGPEPVIGPQQIKLVSLSKPENSLTLATDGVRPFTVKTAPAAGFNAP